ncbi:unnamed protein product, partial [Rhizoctonia solani]
WGLWGPRNLAAGNFTLMPPLSEKKRKRVESIKKAQEGGRKKQARLLNEQLLREGTGTLVQNQNENVVVGADQHDQPLPESPPENRPDVPPNVPPPGSGTVPEAEIDPKPTETPNETTESAYNRPPTTKEAQYARKQVDAATRSPC